MNSHGFFNMRVHPTQLRPYGFAVQRGQILIASSVIFLFVAMGSALSGRILWSHSGAGRTTGSALGPALGSGGISSFSALLSSAGTKIVLLPQVAAGSDGISPALSALDLAFLREASKLGTVSFASPESAANLPSVKERSVQEIKALLTGAQSGKLVSAPSDTGSQVAENPSEFSRVFVPGSSEIYLISPQGEVFAVDAAGHRFPVQDTPDLVK